MAYVAALIQGAKYCLYDKTTPMYHCVRQPSRMSDLGSRGFGNNLRISSHQVEIFRLLPGNEAGNGKGDNLGLRAQEPNGGSVGPYHSTNTAKSFTSSIACMIHCFASLKYF